MDSLVSLLIGPAVVAALVSGTFTLISNERLARQKAAFDRELGLQKRDSDSEIAQLNGKIAAERGAREEEQRRLSERQRTEYSWLYTKRAESMMEIYALLVAMDTAYRNVMQPLSLVWLQGTKQSGFETAFAEAKEAGDAYKAALNPKRILFTRKLAEDLERVSAAYADIYDRFSDSALDALLTSRSEDKEAIDDTMANAKEIIAELEAEFRSLYGYKPDAVQQPE